MGGCCSRRQVSEASDFCHDVGAPEQSAPGKLLESGIRATGARHCRGTLASWRKLLHCAATQLRARKPSALTLRRRAVAFVPHPAHGRFNPCLRSGMVRVIQNKVTLTSSPSIIVSLEMCLRKPADTGTKPQENRINAGFRRERDCRRNRIGRRFLQSLFGGPEGVLVHDIVHICLTT